MTAQIPEILIHRGKMLAMCAQPLYPYLNRLSKKRRPEFVRTSTTCHRGYVGTWEIRDDHLFLVGIEGVLKTPTGRLEATMDNTLPWVKGGALAASWVSDRLRCPEGRLVAYVHNAFPGRYERDRIFEF